MNELEQLKERVNSLAGPLSETLCASLASIRDGILEQTGSGLVADSTMVNALARSQAFVILKVLEPAGLPPEECRRITRMMVTASIDFIHEKLKEVAPDGMRIMHVEMDKRGA